MPRRILITAGPTHEPIDEVRYIANRSSGKMGIAIAEAAREAGWDVTLLLGPIATPPPSSHAPQAIGALPPLLPRGDKGGSVFATDLPGHPAGEIKTIRFTTTEDLRTLLAEHFPKCNVLVMAAAVADYRPAKSSGGKTNRISQRLTLELEPTPDLVGECAKRKHPDQFIVGFALEESDKLRDRAIEKLKRKGLDAIVANPLSTMGADAIHARVFRIRGENGVFEETTPGTAAVDKAAFAGWLVSWIAELASTRLRP